MECKLKHATVHYEVHGSGKPMILIHGFTLDHRMMVGCMEPVMKEREGWQRIYLDLPGMGRTKGEDWIRGSDQMLEVVLEFIEAVIPGQRFVIAGESYGGYMARGVLQRKRELVDGMLLICPMIIADRTQRELPPPVVLVRDEALLATLSEEERMAFEGLGVVLDEHHWERMKAEIIPAGEILDEAFLLGIQANYGYSFDPDVLETPFEKPVLVVTGKQDAVTGYRDAWKIMENYSRGSFAVLDRAGHGLQIEQQELFEALVREWMRRVEECL